MRTEKIVSVSENNSPKMISVIMPVIITMSMSIGIILMLGTAFELEFETMPAIVLSFVTSLAFSSVFFLDRKKFTMGAFIAAASAFTLPLIFNWFNVRTGLLSFFYYVKLYAFYWFPGTYEVPSGDGQDIFAFLFAYNILAVCCTSYLLMKRRLITLGLLTYLPVFLCAVANIVMIPKMVPCLVAGAGIILLLFAYAFRKKSREVSDKAQLILTVPTVLFVALFGMVFPQEKYNKDSFARDILISMQETVDKTAGSGSALSEVLDKAINGFKNPYFEETYDNFSPLYSTTTNLNRVGPFNPTSTEVLRVQRRTNWTYSGGMPMGHTLYLKVESLDTYDNNSLRATRIRKNVYQDDYIESPQGAPCTVEITALSSSGIDIVPYYTDFYCAESEDYSTVNPFNNTHENKVLFAAAPLPVRTGNIYSETYLNNYVYTTCLRVPGATESALIRSGDLPDWYIDVYNGDLEMSDAEKVRRVTEFVSHLHPYDRDTEYPPDDVDFVAWFVSDAESGICVHYAVTTVILLRMIGIPTRYVRGYVDTASYNDTVSIITAEQAHAWFEFFIPEYGWVMGDSTPGYSSDAANLGINSLTMVDPELETRDFASGKDVFETVPETEEETETSEMEESETTETTPEAGETEETTEPGSTPTLVPTTPAGETNPSGSFESEDEAPVVVITLVQSDEEGETDPMEKFFVRLFLTILIVVVSVAVVILILRIVYVMFWKKKFKTGKNDDRAIAYYHYYCFMGRVLRFTIPGKAVKIAEKAAFAEDSLSPAEIKMLLTMCKEHMVECSKSYPEIKKILYRLLLIDITSK